MAQEVIERCSVWVDNRTKRAVVRSIEGPLAFLVGSDFDVYVRPVCQLERLPWNICFMCGVEQTPTDEERKKSVEDTLHAFGSIPPIDRQMIICDKCVPVLAKIDAKADRCVCAFSRGEIAECICARRRADFAKMSKG